MTIFRAWKPEEVVRFFAGFFVCFFLLTLSYVVVEHVLGKSRFHEGSLPFILCSTLPLHGSVIVGTMFCLRMSGLSWNEAFGFSRTALTRTIRWGVIAALLFIPLGMALEGASEAALRQVPPKILNSLHIKLEDQAAVDEFKKADSAAARVYLVVFAVLVAPLAEEILFRGFLYRGLRQMGVPHLAYWGSAFLFAAIHLNARIFIPILAFGLLLAWVYEKNRSLAASFTAHAVFNAINVIFIFFNQDLDHFFDSWRRH